MNSKSLQIRAPDEYKALAESDLTPDEQGTLAEYLNSGKHPLAPDTAAKFFELYLNGSTASEIQRLNKAFPLGAILDAQIRYKWSSSKDRYAIELQERVRDRVMRAQMQTSELMADMLTVAAKQHGDKLKKFIQSGDEKDLDGVMNIESMYSLKQIVETLLKVTGQDRVSKVKTENTQNLNVNLSSGTPGAPADLEPEDAAKVLEILSEARRKKNVENTKK